MFMKSWKTTLFGALVGAIYAVLTTLQTGEVSPKDLIISAGFAFIGVLAKDFNVTGSK